MWCTQNFALIAKGKVQDIVVCDDYNVANQIAVTMHDKDAIAVDVSQYDLQTGDTYKDGKFYRDNKEIQPKESIESQLIKLRASVTEVEEAACEITSVYEDRLAAIEEALIELSILIKGDE